MQNARTDRGGGGARHAGEAWAAYDVAAGDAEGDERGGEAEAAAEGLGPGEDGVVVDDGGAVAAHGGRALDEAQRRERARVGRVRAEPVHAAAGVAGAGGGLACVYGDGVRRQRSSSLSG